MPRCFFCRVILAVAVTPAIALNSAPSANGRDAATIAEKDGPASVMTADGFGSDLLRLESLVHRLGDKTQQMVATPQVWSSSSAILQTLKAPATTSSDHSILSPVLPTQSAEAAASSDHMFETAIIKGEQDAMEKGVQVEAQVSLSDVAVPSPSTVTSLSINSSSAALASLIARLDRWHRTQQQVASVESRVESFAVHATIANASDTAQPSVMALSISDQMFSAAEKDANAGLIMLATDVERVVHKSLSPLDELASRMPQGIQPWMLAVPVGILTLCIGYYIYSQMTANAAPHPAGGNAPATPADDDDDWDILDEKRMQRVFGKPCMRGWCCCTCMVLVNQCPTSLYLCGFLTLGFWTLWRYHMIQPVLQQLMVYLYMALAIVFIAVIIIMNIFTGLKRAGRMVTKKGEDAVDSLQEGFQALQQGLDNVMDAINPFDDSSGDESEAEDAPTNQAPPDDGLTLEDFTCGLIPDPKPEAPEVVFKIEDRVKCRDGPGRWMHGFVVSEGKTGAVQLPYSIRADQKGDPEQKVKKLYVHCDNQTNPRKGYFEIRHIKKGELGYKIKDQALKKLRALQHKRKWHGGRLPAMPSVGCSSGAAPAAAASAAPSS